MCFNYTINYNLSDKEEFDVNCPFVSNILVECIRKHR